MVAAKGVQRPLAQLVEHSQRLLPPVFAAQLRHALVEVLRQLPAFLALAEQFAQLGQLPGNVLHAVRFGDVQRDAESLQHVHLRRWHAARPQQQQIRPQTQQALHVDLSVAA
ncbi:hypothetical protein FQZ97_1028800 [compost metagenome]